MPLDVRAIDTDSLDRVAAPDVNQGFRVFLAESVFDHIVERGNADTSKEVGGILVGKVCRDDRGPYLNIDVQIDARHADEQAAELTFTHETWDHVHQEMDKRYSDRKVVGWWHTHPGFGVFLSDRDQFIHESVFNLPFQVAFVYDPKSKEHGVFAWQSGRPARCRQYWVGSREHAWDGNRMEAATGEAAIAAAVRNSPAPELDDQQPDWLGMALLAAVCLVLGGVGGWWFGRGSGQPVAQVAQPLRDPAITSQMVVNGLQVELIRLWRETMDKDAVEPKLLAVERELAAARAALGAASGPSNGAPPGAADGAGSGTAPSGGAATSPPVDVAKATRQIDDAVRDLRELRLGFHDAAAFLTQLQRAAAAPDRRDEVIVRELGRQQALLGELYGEMAEDAAKQKDPKRARRLLLRAADLDARNHRRYEQQLRAFDPDGTLPGGQSPAPPSGNLSSKPVDFPPAPSPAQAPPAVPAPASPNAAGKTESDSKP